MACSGHTADVGSQGDADGGGGQDGGEIYTPPATGDGQGPEVFTPAQVSAARAQCNAPHGPAAIPPSYGQLAMLVQRSWLLCYSQGDGYLDTSASSRVYDANGQFSDLVPDSAGGLVVANGVDSQGTYDFDEGDAGPDAAVAGPPQMYLHWDSGGGNGGSVSFETSPQRMDLQVDYATEWYVALPAQ